MMSEPVESPQAAPGADVGSPIDQHEPILRVRDLEVVFDTPDGTVRAVNGVSFDLYPGEMLGVVGESGSGKSAMAMSIVRLNPEGNSRIPNGSIYYRDIDLLTYPERQFGALRGARIGVVFQDPMSSLNPVRKVGWQIEESIRRHHPRISKRDARSRAVDLLRQVHIPNPEVRAGQYPHEFSGGMRQRAMIALAIANDPEILIADEPTTALDVTVQAQVLEALAEAQESSHAATVFISHDLGLVGELADRIVVMYAGRIVETGPVTEVFRRPRHPYTLSLLASLPRIRSKVERLTAIQGQPPNPTALPPGCPFAPRCPIAAGRDRCTEELPELLPLGEAGRATRCHFSEELIGLEARGAVGE
jgi:oligopeptide/dipeptide ABC transporter ATP-binding protein